MKKFTQFKNKIWRGYDWIVRRVYKLPEPSARRGFSLGIGSIMWLAWIVPGSPARRAFRNLARVSGQPSARKLYAGYIRRFSLALYRFEVLRGGGRAELGALLDIREPERLDALLARGGVILMMPHAHGSISLAEALGQRHPLVMLARGPSDDGRAAFQRQYYGQMTAEVIDVRRTDEVAVTRSVLSALRGGKIVLGAGDLLKKAPRDVEDKTRDILRVDAFGQPVGAMRWPARFAAKLGAPIVPIMIEQTGDRLTLHLGEELAVTDLREATQGWMDGMVEFVRQYPADWTFALDRRWMDLLANADEEFSGEALASDRRSGSPERPGLSQR